MRRLGLASVLAAGLAPAAAAHPHVFIDAGVELRLDDQGRLAALRIVWVYDEFTSMLILGDLGLDPGRDDRLEPAEIATLAGFDMQWDEGFAGDTFLVVAGQSAALGPPRDWTADYIGGRIVTTHLRDVAEPPDPAVTPVTVQLYDPTYFTAYTLAGAPLVTGRAGCVAMVYGPDIGAATAMLEAALRELEAAGTDVESAFPAVGAAFADEIRLTCPALS
jgi:polyphosphate kinase